MKTKIPRGEEAIVDIAKLRDYCLDIHHPVGKHKARVFAAALGISNADAEFLQAELLRAARELEAIEESHEFGRGFSIDFEVSRGVRRAMIRSVWLIRHGESIPRLITCFVISK